ncbi:AAA family ATPase [Nitrobacter sp. JJSN]|uniref:AAA family ATPase n=1 Tax=Nitrobacter sp. JJSN TaxID=3453033 RepID=UPI003F774842
MKVIALVTQKGGSGKSTLCVSLAVAAQQAGYRVCILEIDRQATATQWSQLRKGEPPEVGQVPADKLDATMARVGMGNDDGTYDFVFIDTPGIDSPGTGAAIRLADLCLIPCRPTPADLQAVRPTLATIHRLEKDFAFVLNQTPPKSYRVRDTAEGLKVLGMIAEVNIVMRNDHQDAMGTGQGVTELNPTGAAAAEVRQLWDWIDNRMKELPSVKAA